MNTAVIYVISYNIYHIISIILCIYIYPIINPKRSTSYVRQHCQLSQMGTPTNATPGQPWYLHQRRRAGALGADGLHRAERRAARDAQESGKGAWQVI